MEEYVLFSPVKLIKTTLEVSERSVSSPLFIWPYLPDLLSLTQFLTSNVSYTVHRPSLRELWGFHNLLYSAQFLSHPSTLQHSHRVHVIAFPEHCEPVQNVQISFRC